MEGKKLLIMSLLIFIITISVTVSAYVNYIYVETFSYPMHLKVSTKGGLSGDRDAIYFGYVPEDGYGKKWFIINNTYDFPIYASVKTTGELADWVVYEPFENPVMSGEFIRVGLIASVPVGAKHRDYVGKLTVSIKRKESLFG